MVTLGTSTVLNVVPAGGMIPLATAGVTDPKPNATMASCDPTGACTIAVLAELTLKTCVPTCA
jgi:hypothetical protein